MSITLRIETNGAFLPAISPDGRYVAWGQGLYDGTTDRTTEQLLYGALADFSSDGSAVAFETNGSRGANLGPNPDIPAQALIHNLATEADQAFNIASSRDFGIGISLSANAQYVAALTRNGLGTNYQVTLTNTATGQTMPIAATTTQGPQLGLGPDSVSADGRYVAYDHDPDGSSGASPVEHRLYDVQTGTYTLITSHSGQSILTAPRFVAFSTTQALVPQDLNPGPDVYVEDLLTGTVTLASTGTGGTPANGESYGNSVSLDGRYVVFQSYATNLVAGDTNGVADIFLKDLQTGVTTRISMAQDGTQANGANSAPVISADAQYVTFLSSASNLGPEDANGVPDLFRVSLNGTAQFSGDRVFADDTYQLQTGEVNLQLVGSDTISGRGNGANNFIVGNDAPNTLRGLDGDDSLNGGLGYDNLNGDAGNDWIYGGGDADVFHGGTGNDALNGGIGADTMYGEGDNDSLFGGDGNDTLSGGDGADYLVGGKGDNAFYGDAGNDSLNDGDGNGYLVGGAGDDGMFGGLGGDQFFSGAGSDWMVGGSGADLFVFAPSDGADTIVDFNVLEDHINLAAVPGIDSFADVQARMSFNGVNTIIDLGGDMITVMNVRSETLTADQFYV
jgi:Ca2+-binding RTX toxin-like protein